jgi:large subunit ribosomal protein L21
MIFRLTNNTIIYNIKSFLKACRTNRFDKESLTMYAVIRTGGKQYKVQENQILKVEKLEGTEGSEIEFNDVLLYSDGETITMGTPVVDNAVVRAHVVEQGRGRKQLVFKYKRRKGYRKMQGHRQEYTQIKIASISA